MLSTLPTYNKSGFVVTEDEWVLNNQGKSDPYEVIISCKGKNRRVRGLLSEGVKLDGEANWQEIFGGGIASIAGSVLDTVNNLDQIMKAQSIQQPWMNRKFWKSTKPFSFSFGMNFVATYDAKTEVYDPTQALLSFTFPREVTSEKLKELKAEKNLGGIVGDSIDSIKAFIIPGPSLAWNGESSDTGDGKEGDAVTLTIGRMFTFGGVYLEKVGIQYSNSMDSEGYPLSAKVQITATCMDVNSVSNEGEWKLDQFRDQQDNISKVLSDLKATGQQLGDDLLNIVKAVRGFYKRG